MLTKVALQIVVSVDKLKFHTKKCQTYFIDSPLNPRVRFDGISL